MLDDACNSINASRKICILTVNTLTGQNVRLKSQQVFDLKNAAMHSEHLYPVPLAYSRDFISHRDPLPTGELVSSFQHLAPIADEIHHTLDIPVGLRLRVNCVDVLTATHVIPSYNTGLFAQKTVLGWTNPVKSTFVLHTQCKELVQS